MTTSDVQRMAGEIFSGDELAMTAVGQLEVVQSRSAHNLLFSP